MTFHEIESLHKRLAAIEKLKAIYSRDITFNHIVNLLADSGLTKKEIRQAADLASFFKECNTTSKDRVILRSPKRRYLDIK